MQRPPRSDDDPIGDLVAEAFAAVDRDGPGALDDLCQEHPEHAGELRRRFRALEAMGLARPDRSDHPFPERLGEFRLLERLGGGGMGVVYLAEQESLGRRVALKLIRPERLYFAHSRERFRREAAVVARLQHPNIVPIYAFGESDGVPYFATQWLRGVTLAEALRALHGRDPNGLTGRDLRRAVSAESVAEEQRTPELFAGTWVETCFRVTLAVAEAIAHAHAHGVLHRDIKPSNVMVDGDGRVTLLDFGLARDEGAPVSLTEAGSQPGSLPYMSPEQVHGDRALVDERSDVFSLGVTLYELLTLCSPFGTTSSEATRRRILDGRVPPIRERNRHVPWDAETVCLTAIEPDPPRRYPTARAFADDLLSVLELRSIDARRPGPALRARRWVQRHPTRTVALAAAVVIVLLAALTPLLLWWQERAAFRQAEGRRLTATAATLVRTDPGLALLLAIEGAARHRDLAADNALIAALSACHELRTLRASDNGTFDCAFDPTGALVATAGSDGDVMLWNAADGSLIGRLDGHVGLVRAVAFDASGRRLVTASEDATARVFDVPSRRPVAVLRGHEAAVTDAAFDPRGERIATVSADHAVRLWRADDGAPLGVLGRHEDVVYRARFSPDGTRVATASEDRSVRVFDLTSPGAAPLVIRAPGARERYWGAVYDVDWTPDGARLAIPSADGTTRIHAAADGALLHEIAGHSREIKSGRFGPDGRLVLTASYDGTAHVLDAVSGTMRHVLRGHSDWLYHAEWSPDGRQCATASRDGTACLWDAESGALHTVLKGHDDVVRRAVFAPDGRRVLTASLDGTVRIWQVPEKSPSEVHDATILAIAPSPDGRGAIATAADGKARVLGLAPLALGPWLIGHAGPVLGARFDRAGARALTWSQDRTARLWDTATGATLHTLGEHDVFVEWAAFADDDRRVVTASSGVVRVWDATSGALLTRVELPRNTFRLPSLDPERRRVAAGSYPSGKLLLLDTTTFASELRELTGGVRAAAWLGSGGDLLVADRHGAVTRRRLAALTEVGRVLWREAAGERTVSVDADRGRVVIAYDSPLALVAELRTGSVVELRGHAGAVHSAAFDVSGGWVVTTSADGTARVWDVATGDERMTLLAGDARVTCAAFTQDGASVLLGASDGTVRTVPVDADPLRTALARRPRELGPAERARFGIADR